MNKKKQPKQQVISRFFAPKPKPPNNDDDTPNPTPKPSLHSPSKVTATVSFSPAKRQQLTQLTNNNTSSPKRPKLSPHTLNQIPPINKTLHQNFLNKLLEPSEHISDHTHVAKPDIKQTHVGNSSSKFTPLEQQVLELKRKYPDVILMIEVGYKYRFFGSDAEVAARVLGIYSHMDHSFLTASVPTFRLNVHVRRLVSEGYKVGVVKQTETASIKAHGSNRVGPFSRGLSALYTKATIEAVEGLGGGEEGCGGLNNYLVCVVEKEVEVENLECGIESGFEVRVGVVAVETSTGDVVYGEFNDGFMRGGIEAIVFSLAPSELLLGMPLSKRTEKLLVTYAGPASNARVERASCDCFKDGGALAELMSLFETNEGDLGDHQDDIEKEADGGSQGLAIKGIMGMPALAVQALALTIRHLKQFGLERILSLGASFRPFSTNVEMNLSANTLQQLEVLKNNANGSESGSLLQTMNHTLTVFGQRLLRHWVTHPLCDRNMIAARLDAVAEVAESMGGFHATDSSQVSDEGDLGVATSPSDISNVLASVLAALGQSLDVQRGITRIFHKTATPSEFVAVIQAIQLAAKQLQQLETESVRSALLRNLIQTASSPSLISCSAGLLSVLNKEAVDKADMLNLISVDDGRFSEVGTARTKVQMVMEKLESLVIVYKKQLGMRNLSFMTVAATTHLVELPSEARVPSNWVKVNSTKKTVRYHPPEVLTALDQLSLANEELTIVCRAAWNRFLGDFSKHYAEFQAAVQALAALDCLNSLALLSRNKNYVRPVFVGDNEPVQIHITSARHPVLETVLHENFVPNDTHLHGDQQYCQIVTGPNMGGKSCYIRQVALVTIMAQVGSFVPASSAKLHVLDAVYTRMGASDNIQQGRSTFLEELSEASYILRNCTGRSLVILDELGRGTSTHDGVAIAYSTLHYLLEQKRCMVLFVTHYPKIADIQKEFPGVVGTYHVSYLTSGNDINSCLKPGQTDGNMDHEDVTYLYKLVPGVCERSFGFKVAQLAQLPPSCIKRAMVMATKLETLIQKRVWKHQEILSSSESSLTGLHGDKEEGSDQFTVACGKFFQILWSFLQSDDPTKSPELLKCATGLATELVVW